MIKLLNNSLSLLYKENSFFIQKTINFFMATRKRRVRELSEIKISLNQQQKTSFQSSEAKDYIQLQKQIRQMNWQTMQFDKLCNLPQSTIQMLSIQMKKDKFNIQDRQFYGFMTTQETLSIENNKNKIQKLNKYYKKIYYLLSNYHGQYENMRNQTKPRSYYKHQIYNIDLKEDQRLINNIEYFINNLIYPQSLEAIVEPSFVKYLLSLKRQLMIQGIYFQHHKQKRMKRAQLKKKLAQQRKNQSQSSQLDYLQQNKDQTVEMLNIEQEDMIDENEIELQENEERDEMSKDKYKTFHRIIMQQLKRAQHKIKIKQVLGYQYEFWVDLKHNRNKNGRQEDYIIEQRQIDNPNDSSFIKQQFPKVKVKYFIHKKKRRQFSMHFCIKASLMIEINGQHKRKVKVEWRGPSNKQTLNNEQAQYVIIDYQNLMNGNPTLKPIFYF